MCKMGVVIVKRMGRRAIDQGGCTHGQTCVGAKDGRNGRTTISKRHVTGKTGDRFRAAGVPDGEPVEQGQLQHTVGRLVRVCGRGYKACKGACEVSHTDPVRGAQRRELCAAWLH